MWGKIQSRQSMAIYIDILNLYAKIMQNQLVMLTSSMHCNFSRLELARRTLLGASITVLHILMKLSDHFWKQFTHNRMVAGLNLEPFMWFGYYWREKNRSQYQHQTEMASTMVINPIQSHVFDRISIHMTTDQ
jgi:hypothetical protein